MGLSADFLPHVFELFVQGVRTVDRSQGGLERGLALVKSLAALHEGTVNAHGEGPGNGSCFSVRHPGRGIPAIPDDGLSFTYELLIGSAFDTLLSTDCVR